MSECKKWKKREENDGRSLPERKPNQRKILKIVDTNMSWRKEIILPSIMNVDNVERKDIFKILPEEFSREERCMAKNKLYFR